MPAVSLEFVRYCVDLERFRDFDFADTSDLEDSYRDSFTLL